MIHNLEIIGSKDLKIKSTSLHDSAIRLIEGGIVECDGHCVKAVEVSDQDLPCFVCKMDSACSPKLQELCVEVDLISGSNHYLDFVSDNQ